MNFSNVLIDALDMHSEELKIKLESVKLSLRSLNGGKADIKDIMKNSLEWMLNRYEVTKDESFLDGGVLQILAWLDMGLHYSHNQEIFDRILIRKGIDKELLLQNAETTGKKYRLSKNRIRTFIGRWRRGSETDLKFEVVIDDIYDRIEKGTVGKMTYCSHYSNRELFAVYEVIVTEEQRILKDVIKEKYYYFEV